MAHYLANVKSPPPNWSPDALKSEPLRLFFERHVRTCDADPEPPFVKLVTTRLSFRDPITEVRNSALRDRIPAVPVLRESIRAREAEVTPPGAAMHSTTCTSAEKRGFVAWIPSRQAGLRALHRSVPKISPLPAVDTAPIASLGLNEPVAELPDPENLSLFNRLTAHRTVSVLFGPFLSEQAIPTASLKQTKARTAGDLVLQCE
jgi:hypothetical protein